jgi:homoserine dehydrogenase
VRIGLLGCGTVGQAVVRTLGDGGSTIERASGHRLEVAKVLVRDAARERPGIDPSLITTDPAEVLEDPSIAIVVEVMGGLDPTLGYLERAIARGASVVTANKQLL